MCNEQGLHPMQTLKESGEEGNFTYSGNSKTVPRYCCMVHISWLLLLQQQQSVHVAATATLWSCFCGFLKGGGAHLVSILRSPRARAGALLIHPSYATA